MSKKTSETERFTLVVAGNRQEYERWLEQHPDEDRAYCRQVSDVPAMQGYTAPKVVFTGTWYDLKESAQLRDIASRYASEGVAGSDLRDPGDQFMQ